MTEWIKIVLLAAIAGGVGYMGYQNHEDNQDLSRKLTQVTKKLDGMRAQGGGEEAPTTDLDVTPYLSDTDASWGPKDAAVVVVEFSDFQCPFCRRFADDTSAKIREAYGDKIRYVFKNLPLKSIHPHALGAALAGQCAQEQGKFWEYYHKLFENQRNLDADKLADYAEAVGINKGKFTACVARKDIADKIEADIQGAIKLGVNGTPGFIIAGTKLSGAQPFENFKAEIDKALAEAKK